MRFGGHETFAPREGWLSKGLSLLARDPEDMDHPLVADDLGVGRNMAKSIKHWLIATGLARRERRSAPLELTELGETVLYRDPYMIRPGTWWALHANLVAPDDTAVTWSWFFNTFSRERFDRMSCVDQLARHVSTNLPRPPSRNTLQRDVTCLLHAYARSVPPEQDDPEEGRDSPFRVLDLLVHLRESDTYQGNRTLKEIPPELLGYSLESAFGTASDQEVFDVSFSEALASPGSPGRAFLLTGEALWDLLVKAESLLPDNQVMTHMLGGQRAIRVRRQGPSKWLEHYYQRRSHA